MRITGVEEPQPSSAPFWRRFSGGRRGSLRIDLMETSLIDVVKDGVIYVAESSVAIRGLYIMDDVIKERVIIYCEGLWYRRNEGLRGPGHEGLSRRCVGFLFWAFRNTSREIIPRTGLKHKWRWKCAWFDFSFSVKNMLLHVQWILFPVASQGSHVLARMGVHLHAYV